ncbi:hypothetical protein Xcel_0589 [Xylanimonas cellulosilytica DSM 15894]|uniref:Uncharacterized protein n=1 Tax=Xylanimonas cellulosilytica (strain DSM 15894 / JCM 12276 / CECT 5975 / KCTC 9989 / LMG 20990 / NBRC 107835 / XIL07) TaxID=446471 RepID=D1BWP6_XYLCX|nr:hypothetical protein [Xylanimonas cellulosilytica]ACZ29628.1 hypothetical protein Xcel_0589 [Xylanimonas cellulosilytica DSM 15894]
MIAYPPAIRRFEAALAAVALPTPAQMQPLADLYALAHGDTPDKQAQRRAGGTP